jgi:hypothetical protein
MYSQMKRLVLSAMIAVGALAPAAHAKVRTIAPPGNSGVQQYDEIIPTVSGSRPTSSVHPVSVAGGGHNGGGPSGSQASGGLIKASTQQQLAAQGAAGADAAALARATAPSILRQTTPAGAKKSSASSGRSAGAAIQTGGGTSPVGAVADTLTGSTSSGGLGTLLPVILLVTLVGSAAWAVLRRRGET